MITLLNDTSSHSITMMDSGRHKSFLSSPFLFAACLLALAVMTLKYWSLSNKMRMMGAHMEEQDVSLKTEKFNVKNVQAAIEKKEESLVECKDDKADLQAALDSKIEELEYAEEVKLQLVRSVNYLFYRSLGQCFKKERGEVALVLGVLFFFSVQ